MHRRRLLQTALPTLSAAVAGCSTHGSASRSPPKLHMTFLEATPSDRPLVGDGLDADDPTTGAWAHVFTRRPESAVFTERIDEASPHMRSQITADRYDERFTVLLQKRFATPAKLAPVVPHQIEWRESDRLRVVVEPQSIGDPSAELRDADSVVATTLFIFEYETHTPDVVRFPIRGDDGAVTETVLAR